jgi:hypothetical protein
MARAAEERTAGSWKLVAEGLELELKASLEAKSLLEAGSW